MKGIQKNIFFLILLFPAAATLFNQTGCERRNSRPPSRNRVNEVHDGRLPSERYYGPELEFSDGEIIFSQTPARAFVNEILPTNNYDIPENKKEIKTLMTAGSEWISKDMLEFIVLRDKNQNKGFGFLVSYYFKDSTIMPRVNQEVFMDSEKNRFSFKLVLKNSKGIKLFTRSSSEPISGYVGQDTIYYGYSGSFWDIPFTSMDYYFQGVQNLDYELTGYYTYRGSPANPVIKITGKFDHDFPELFKGRLWFGGLELDGPTSSIVWDESPFARSEPDLSVDIYVNREQVWNGSNYKNQYSLPPGESPKEFLYFSGEDTVSITVWDIDGFLNPSDVITEKDFVLSEFLGKGMLSWPIRHLDEFKMKIDPLGKAEGLVVR